MRRRASQRHYLMVRPTYFTVCYSINPWMDPGKPTYTDLAVAQWEWLRDLLVELGHRIDELTPRDGLPDMVFAASGAVVLGGRALVARFRHRQRFAESDAYLNWFAQRGFRDVRQAWWVNEGEGDYLVAGRRVLAGCGFRTNTEAHREFEDFFGRPVLTLDLVDPRYYQLDLALSVLDEDTVMYYPAAFTPESRAVLADLYPDAIIATEADAAAFGLNALSDGCHVVLSHAAYGLIGQLREHGFEAIGADVSELLKSGGGVKCCTLQVRT